MALTGGACLGGLWHIVSSSYLQVIIPQEIAVFGAILLAAAVPCLLLQVRPDKALPSAVLQALDDEIWVIDSTTENLRYFNRAAEKRAGRSKLGKPIWDSIPTTEHACLRAALDNPERAEQDPLNIDAAVLRPHIVLLDDSSHVMIILRDVAEGLALDALKDEFIANVSHELRSPLTSIKGSMGLLLSNAAGELSKPARGLLEIAHRNAERLILIINDILDLQKIVDGGMEFQVREIDAAALVHEAIAASTLHLQRFDLHVDVKGADAPVVLFSDPNRIIQVLNNLLTNAAKFSRPNGTVTVELGQVDGCVTISVRDDGPGIPVADQGMIFERFADMSNSQRVKKGGSGLGLSISKAIVEKLGGTIGFDTVEGVGTVFQFSVTCGVIDGKVSLFTDRMRRAG
ncbi:MAG: HAMP domain-containing sensor histidine kinase [Sulfitobacter sp.]